MLFFQTKISFSSLLLIALFSTNLSGQGEPEIYQISGSDSTLTIDFINAVCEAVITQSRLDQEYELEHLLSKASKHLTPDSVRSLIWHRRFGNKCICPPIEDYERMNFLRLVVISNFRAFANIIGPKNRLPLDFDLVDPVDSLNIYDFVNNRRIEIEARYDDKRFEFQQDEEWRNLMFFYFLFSEFYLKR